MANKSDNFWGGFLVGTAVGAAIGAIVAVKLTQNQEEDDSDNEYDHKFENRDIAYTLEEKIAQLNSAIDAVSAELAAANNKGIF